MPFSLHELVCMISCVPSEEDVTVASRAASVSITVALSKYVDISPAAVFHADSDSMTSRPVEIEAAVESVSLSLGLNDEKKVSSSDTVVSSIDASVSSSNEDVPVDDEMTSPGGKAADNEVVTSSSGTVVSVNDEATSCTDDVTATKWVISVPSTEMVLYCEVVPCKNDVTVSDNGVYDSSSVTVVSGSCEDELITFDDEKISSSCDDDVPASDELRVVLCDDNPVACEGILLCTLKFELNILSGN